MWATWYVAAGVTPDQLFDPVVKIVDNTVTEWCLSGGNLSLREYLNQHLSLYGETDRRQLHACAGENRYVWANSWGMTALAVMGF
jgi:hypothetical protein